MSSTNGNTPFIPAVSDEIKHERAYRHIRSERQLSAYNHKFTERQQQIPGLLIPIHRLAEPTVYTFVLRPDTPRIDHTGKMVKYEWPERVPLCLDVLPRYRELLSDATIPIWITEGAKKADALASSYGATIVPISINGVWCWMRKGKDGASHPLDDFDSIIWNGRTVVLAFDSDVCRKEEVQKALRALARHLRDRGAMVRVLVLPQKDNQKIGVDDALAAGMTPIEMQTHVRNMDELPPPAVAGGQSEHAILDFFRDAPLTDAGNAECLEVLYQHQLRYCHDRKKWLAWDGNRWLIDGDGEVERAALTVVRTRRRVAAQIDDPDRARKAFNWALGSESEGKRSAMLSTARILRTFATKVDLYDQDPMAAGVPNGVLELETGQHRPSRREDYITAQLGADYDPAATCPRWLQFLDEVFAGDTELIAFIQRAIGYSLTGDTREHKLFLCFGHGANGKSVFLDVLSRLLGEYAANTSFDTFDAGRRNEATNDLAALKGKRLVTVIETEDDRRLAEARVKQVTGQDKVTCRFLYGEYFDYRPQFKIWMAMNHKPVINGTDNGIWRRIQLIPFTQSFLEHEDKTLGTKLHAELPGILNWALAGLADWLRDGLGTAEAIEAATREYRRESDLVSQWLDECTERGDVDAQLLTGSAIDSYAAWCKRNGYRTPTARVLGRRLVELGYETGRTGGRRYYVGLVLLDSDISDIKSPFSGKSSLESAHDPLSPKQANDVTDVTTPTSTNGTNSHSATGQPRKHSSAEKVLVHNYLRLAESGDRESLRKAREIMAANGGQDWSAEIVEAVRIAARHTDIPDYGQAAVTS